MKDINREEIDDLVHAVEDLGHRHADMFRAQQKLWERLTLMRAGLWVVCILLLLDVLIRLIK